MSKPIKETSEERYDVEQIYDFIVGFKRRHDGLSPTIREIQAKCGISTTSMVTWLLRKLELQGKIKCMEAVARGIMVTGGVWSMDGGDKPSKHGGARRTKANYGNVVFDPSGDFSGKEFSTQEIRDMVAMGALETGTVYELNGCRITVAGVGK